MMYEGARLVHAKHNTGVLYFFFTRACFKKSQKYQERTSENRPAFVVKLTLIRYDASLKSNFNHLAILCQSGVSCQPFKNKNT